MVEAMSENRSPSLIIGPHQSEFQRQRTAGFGRPDPYGGEEGIAAARETLIASCGTIQAALDQQPERAPYRIGLAQLSMRDARIAKRHRPIGTFSRETCQIIGQNDGLGKLLVTVTPQGLDRLRQRIQAPPSRDEAVLLTGIESFVLLDDASRLSHPMEGAIRERIARVGRVRVRVRLPRFELFTPLYQAQLESAFHRIEGIHDSPYLTLGNFLIYAADLGDIEQVLHLAELPFINRVEIMPRYRPVVLGTSALNLAGAISSTVRLGPIPDDLATIVIADTGVAEGSILDPLICARDTFIVAPPAPAHGTAVAALAAAENDLASGLLVPRNCIVDLRVFASDEEELDEDDLILRLQDAVTRYGPTYKVWNLSFASVPGIRPDAKRFSPLGQRLNEWRKQYGLMFVCATGNRAWDNPRTAFPPEAEEDDWIGTPGDTLSNIAVTSLAPDDAPPDALARPHEPSPFVGHGPGPGGVPLALLAEYGGNMTATGAWIGVATLGLNGDVQQMVGTSFTTPKVGGSLAELSHYLERSVQQTGHGSHVEHDALLLAKAVMFHHATVPPLMARDVNLMDYVGFGVPPDLEELVGDPFWRSTTLISTTLAPNGDDLVVDHFPFPPGLRKERFCHGELLVTLVTEPLLKSGDEIEYVRSHVDLKFGPAFDGEAGQVRIEPNLLTLKTAFPPARFEQQQIKEEQKWAPFRRYHKVLRGVGLEVDRWALRAHLTLRAEESNELREAKADVRHPQRFINLAKQYQVRAVIAVTILDPQRIVRVSDEMVQQWRIRGYTPLQIEIAQRIRSQFIVR